MVGGGKSILKLFSSSMHSHSSSSRNLQPPPPPPLPAAFLCPISNLIMANPVVIPSGHCFDGPCIDACRELNFTPSHLNLNLIIPSSTSTSPFPIIPNMNLYHAIVDWCNKSGQPFPTPISDETARYFVKGLMSFCSPPPSIEPCPYSIDPEKEQRILGNLKKPKHSSIQSAFSALIDTLVCSPRILAAVIPFLTCEESKLQIVATQAMYKLSLDPANRAHILLSGAVTSLIVVLATAIRRAHPAAAGVFYMLAVDESNRLAIGALGAIPALLDTFCEHFLSHVGRREAALALYYLSQCRQNLEVLVEGGAVERVMEAAGNETSPQEMRRYALVLLHCMMEAKKGREEVMDGGGIEVLLRMLRERRGVGMYSLMVMHSICRQSLGRFREVAGAARGGEVLMGEMGDLGERGIEMARDMVRVIRGELREGEKLKEVMVSFKQEGMEQAKEEKEEGEQQGGVDRKGKKKVE